MTSILNGKRCMFIEPLSTGKHLHRFNYCGHMAVVSQKKISICHVQTAGKPIIIGLHVQMMLVVSKAPGHSPGDETCPHCHPQKHLTTFFSAQDLLANFYPCELEIFGVKHKSAEHDFQYIKAVRCGDLFSANTIAKADDALAALCWVRRSNPMTSGCPQRFLLWRKY